MQSSVPEIARQDWDSNAMSERKEITQIHASEHVEDHSNGSLADSESNTPQQAFSRSWPSVLCCIFAPIGPLIYGFDMVIVGAYISMPAFQIDYGTPFHGKFIIPALWQSLWNSLVQLGVIIGSVGNGAFQDRLGRRWGFRSGAVIRACGVAILYCSNLPASVEDRQRVFLVGKIILGVGLGLLLSTCQIYVSECAPSVLREPLLSFFTFSQVVGQLIAISVVNTRILIFTSAAFKVILASQWSWCGALFVGSFIIPESPYYLATRDRLDDARKALGKLHVVAGDPEIYLTHITNTLEHEKVADTVATTPTFRECLTGSNGHRTAIVSMTLWMQQFLGITLIASGPYFLQMAGMNFVKAINITMVGIGLTLPAVVISWYTMTRFWRRRLLLISFVTVGTLWFSVGVADCWPMSPTSFLYIGIMLQIMTFFYGLGGGSVIPVIAAETSSARLRGKSRAIAFFNAAFSSWLFNFVTTYMFNADESNLGGKCGFILGGFCIVGFVVSCLYIPETKGRTFAELDEMFEQRIPTRRFGTYVCSSSPAEGRRGR